MTARDDEQCPVRPDGFTHTLDGAGRCADCRCDLDAAPRELRPGRYPGAFTRPAYAPIPVYLRTEYQLARDAGLSDDDAQSDIAAAHGLRPAGERSWTLFELAKFEFVAWRASRSQP